jgi:lipoate-protein ligase A
LGRTPAWLAAPVGIAARADAYCLHLGHCAGEYFHATYAALASMQAAYARPVIVYARPTAHLCLGQHSIGGDSSLASDTVPVLRRRLGGGTVWIDEDQLCVVVIAPIELSLRDRFERSLLAVAVETFQHFGLPAYLKARDVWVRGRKVCGSGGATLGSSSVLGFSFMRRFPAERFASAVTLPCNEMRGWMIDALRLTMTDWATEGIWPSERLIRRVFEARIHANLGWRCRAAALGDMPIAETSANDDDDDWIGANACAASAVLRLNALSCLRMEREAAVCRDSLVVNDKVVRVKTHAATNH